MKQEIKGADVTAEMHKLALPIEESIVLVNIEDIVYVGLMDGKVTVKAVRETYVTHDTLVILEKSCHKQVSCVSIVALLQILIILLKFSHGSTLLII